MISAADLMTEVSVQHTGRRPSKMIQKTANTDKNVGDTGEILEPAENP